MIKQPTIDLHQYSSHSLGKLTPQELVQRAADSGLSTIAIADRGTWDSYVPALLAAQQQSISVIRAVELSVQSDSFLYRVIGYGFTPNRAVRTLVAAPRTPLAQDAISVLQAAGGVVILAAPALVHANWNLQNHNYTALDRLVDLGLDGVEVHIPAHDPAQRLTYEQWAVQHNLIVTGGSYFTDPRLTTLGSWGMSEAQYVRLLDLLHERARATAPLPA